MSRYHAGKKKRRFLVAKSEKREAAACTTHTEEDDSAHEMNTKERSLNTERGKRWNIFIGHASPSEGVGNSTGETKVWGKRLKHSFLRMKRKYPNRG